MITMRTALFSLTVVQILMCCVALGDKSNGTGDDSMDTRYLTHIFRPRHHSGETTEFSQDLKENSSTTTPVKKYHWTVVFSPCLEGIKEVNLYCVHIETARRVTPDMCEPSDKPDDTPIPCPKPRAMPEWSTTEFSPCSKPCGIGIQSREISCVIRQEEGTFEEVPRSLCSQYSPAIRQFCNIIDCAIMWTTSSWDKCRNPCGQEFTHRTVECKQTLARNHEKRWPQTSCAHLPKPESRKECDRSECGIYKQKYRMESVQLTGNVTATVYDGVTVYMQCLEQGRSYNGSVDWTRDGQEFQNERYRDGRLKLTKVQANDSGLYRCYVENKEGFVDLKVEPPKGDHVPNSTSVSFF